MEYCNKCSCYNCNCITQQTNLISDQAGRDGLSAKDILISIGKLPTNATDNQFYDSIKGEKGDPGTNGLNGGGVYLNTEW